jgi:hypothetical protein
MNKGTFFVSSNPQALRLGQPAKTFFFKTKTVCIPHHETGVSPSRSNPYARLLTELTIFK